MHVIGEGPDSKMIWGLKVNHEFFTLINTGVYSGTALDEYLVKNIDVLAAMGISALEGAKFGIPTILLDVSYGPIDGDYVFKWLYESSSYGLGDMIDESHFSKGNLSLDRIISQVRNDYATISDRTYEYFNRNHSISSVCEKFIDSINEATFTYSDISPKLLRKTKMIKLYDRLTNIYKNIKKKIVKKRGGYK
jgi:hypothetical protein